MKNKKILSLVLSVAMAAATIAMGGATVTYAADADVTVITKESKAVFSFEEEVNLYNQLAPGEGMEVDEDGCITEKEASGLLFTSKIFDEKIGDIVGINSYMYPVGQGYQAYVSMMGEDGTEISTIYNISKDGKNFSPIYVSTTDDSEGSHPVDVSALFAGEVRTVENQSTKDGFHTTKTSTIKKGDVAELDLKTNVYSFGKDNYGSIMVSSNTTNPAGKKVSDLHIFSFKEESIFSDETETTEYFVIVDYVNDTTNLLLIHKANGECYYPEWLVKNASKSTDAKTVFTDQYTFSGEESSYNSEIAISFDNRVVSVEDTIKYFNEGVNFLNTTQSLDFDLNGKGKAVEKSVITDKKQVLSESTTSVTNTAKGYKVSVDSSTSGQTYLSRKLTSANKTTDKINTYYLAPDLKVGKTVKINNIDSHSGKKVKSVTYSSSNKKVATVSKKGKIKGIKAGDVDITVKTTYKDGSVCTYRNRYKVVK